MTIVRLVVIVWEGVENSMVIQTKITTGLITLGGGTLAKPVLLMWYKVTQRMVH